MTDPKPEPSNPAATAAAAMAKAARPIDADAGANEAMPAAPRQIQLRVGDWHLLDYVNNQYSAIAPIGTQPEDYDARPEACALVSSGSLKVYDEVRLKSADGSWWAEYLIVDCGLGFADMRLMRKMKIPPRQSDAETRVPEGYTIRQGLPGEQPGWVVIRKKTNLLMNLGTHIHQKEMALRWLIDHPSLRMEDNGNLRR